MPIWTYRPQDVLEETTTPQAVRSVVGPLTMYVNQYVPQAAQRLFRLHYTVVDSTTLAGMVSFYMQRRGTTDAFDWIHPVTQEPYRVRFGQPFGGAITPRGLASTAEIVFVVTSD